MTEYELIPVAPIVLIIALLMVAILILTVNAWARTADPDTRAGMAWLIAADIALLSATTAVLLGDSLSFEMRGALISIFATLTILCGYGGLSRGLGNRPSGTRLLLVWAGVTGTIATLIAAGADLREVLTVSSGLNGTMAAVMAVRLHQQTSVMGRAQVQLTTLPFALIVGIYALRMLAAAWDATPGILSLLTLALAFLLTFATLQWCFALLAFGNVRLTRSLRHERARAEDANRLKSQFLANMSHEIRTPLNGVLGMAQLLEDRLPPGPEREMSTTIRQSGGALLGILNDILDLAKIEAGRIELHVAPFDMAGLLVRVEQLHRPQAAMKGVALELRSGPGLDRPLTGDEMRLLQVLHNLVGNAVKFTERGTVAIEADWTPAPPAPDRGWLRLAVIDTGIGMSREQQDRVFEDFVQADGAITRRFGGTGLGLSISRRLVDLMGGTIRVSSVEGQGSRFEIVLPTSRSTALPPAPAPEPAPPARLATGMAVPAPELAGLRLLVAEDNATNQRVLAGMLAPSGVALTMVDDGGAALAVFGATLRGGGPPFDLVLLDIQMPRMDGVSALTAMRELASELGKPPPPAIALTANVMPAQIAAYLAAGFAAHLGKPVRKSELVQTVARLAPRPQAAPTPAPGEVRLPDTAA